MNAILKPRDYMIIVRVGQKVEKAFVTVVAPFNAFCSRVHAISYVTLSSVGLQVHHT